MSDETFEAFEAFGQALLDAGISHVVQREILEIRPRGGEGHSVVVGKVHEATFIGYRQGRLLQCQVQGEALERCAGWLAAHSIRVKVVSGNIG